MATANTPQATSKIPAGTERLTPSEVATVARLAGLHWIASAAKLLGVSRTTLLAAMSGAPIRRGSAELIRRRLREIKRDGDRG